MSFFEHTSALSSNILAINTKAKNQYLNYNSRETV